VTTNLEPPDLHHANAALGWLDFNDHVEAGNEIARISEANLMHPDVLEIRWSICAQGKSWDAAAEIGRNLVEVAPNRASGWVHRAYAVRRMRGGGIEQAEELLLPALARFPRDPLIAYNLACYAAQLGNLDQAWERFQLALKKEGAVDAIKARALEDTDLEPLWDRIRKL
jgi:tetratricopeptide (TPR) repeat protein